MLGIPSNMLGIPLSTTKLLRLKKDLIEITNAQPQGRVKIVMMPQDGIPLDPLVSFRMPIEAS